MFDTHTVWAQRVWGESLLNTLLSRAGHETQCGSGTQRNDFQHGDCVTRLWSWMWSLPYGGGTRAFKGNCIPPLLFLFWHFPLTLVSKFIFDLDQKFSRSSGFTENISIHKHIRFWKVNVTRKQICYVQSFKNCGFICRWLITKRLTHYGALRTIHTDDLVSTVGVWVLLCSSAYLRQILMFVCSVMDISSELQDDALHQREALLDREGELQLGVASRARLQIHN